MTGPGPVLHGFERRLAIVGLAPALRAVEGYWQALDIGAPTGRRLRDLLGRSVWDVACTANVLELPDDAIRGPAASQRGGELRRLLVREGVSRTVVLGMDAARLMGLRWGVPASNIWFEWTTEGLYYAVAPHPSGRSRWWNVPGNHALARAWFHDVADGYSYGIPARVRDARRAAARQGQT